MKVRTVFMLLVLFFGLIGSNQVAELTQEEEQLDKDNFGKVIIQLLKPNNSENVDEIFKVVIFKSLKLELESRAIEWMGKTDINGHLLINLKPGIYYLQVLPESNQSSYALEPSPLLSEINRNPIVVEKQKVTKVFKKVNSGCQLKIILIDPNGKKIIPQEDFFEGINITVKLFSTEGNLGIVQNNDLFYMFDKSFKGKMDLNDGELIISRLYPGHYKISIYFGFLGYRDEVIDNIQITQNQMFVKEVVVNLDDNTGLDGYITDQNGEALIDVLVKTDSATSKTDQNGYYRIVGLEEGIQSIHIVSNPNDTSDIFINEIFDVIIKVNTIIRRNFVIDVK